METLRTQVDSLQWEINRMDAENRKLRSQNADASEWVDLELKVEQLEGEARKELLAIKEVMTNKQADFEQTIGAKEKQLWPNLGKPFQIAHQVKSN